MCSESGFSFAKSLQRLLMYSDATVLLAFFGSVEHGYINIIDFSG